jgi:hypothetical protein
MLNNSLTLVKIIFNIVVSTEQIYNLVQTTAKECALTPAGNP